MRRIGLALPATILIASATILFGQAAAQSPPPSHTSSAKAEVKKATRDEDVTYGRIKELTAGQKVVIDVDNAPDKTFDLSDKDVRVNLAKGLKVGDPVKVTEHEVAGKTKSVSITKHTGGGVAHGDKDAAAKKP